MSAALAHYAALDCLKAGGDAKAAHKAAAQVIRPGGAGLQWNEYYEARRAVETATEEINMNINEAQAAIETLTREFTAALHAKGYEKACIQIWIGREATLLDKHTLYVDKAPLQHRWGTDIAEMVERFRADLAALPHRDAEARAYADELAQPLFLMSEHYAQAAE